MTPTVNALPRAAALLIVEPEAEAGTERLLAAWRHSGRPVVHVRPLGGRSPDRMAPLRPRAGEVVVQRQAASAFADTGLEPLLRDRRIATLVVAGGLGSGSVAATLRRAGQLGFETYLVSDGATRSECAGLGGAGATLAITEDVLSAL